MKRLLPFAPLLLLAALLLSPAAALSGARQGLDMWWGQVLPALLPSFICIRLAQNLGFLRLAGDRPKAQLAVVVGFSLVSGAPNGARLLHALMEDGSLSSQEGNRLLPLVNCVSPAFLLTIISSQLLKNKALFLPMALAFYGCILCLTLPRMCRQKHGPVSSHSTETADTSFSAALSSAIESGMLDMLKVGGCILFICTLLSLVEPIIPGESAYAALAGCMEVTIGVSTLARLSLPLRLKASLLIGISAFGGLSLALQSMCCCPELRLVPYLLRKLLLGVLIGFCCYLLFPLFPGVAAAFASRQEVLARSLSLSALLLSSALSAAFVGLLSLMVAPRKRI